MSRLKHEDITMQQSPERASRKVEGQPRPLRRRRWVCEHFDNINDRTLTRWLEDPRLNFPRPVTIRGLDYFDEAEIIAFQARLSQRAAA